MSEKAAEDTNTSATSQSVHVFPLPPHAIPPSTVPPGILPSFIEHRHNPTSSPHISRPSHHFPASSYHDSSLTLAGMSATTPQSVSTYPFSTTAVTTTTLAQRPVTGITQVLAADLISHGQPGHAQSPQTANQLQSQQQQHQFQKLKVEDALSYLDQVKFQFGNQPQVYNDFLDIMKEFKSQSIDTPGVIARVSHLFNGHPDLIVGFNTFLPPGYKIEVSANDQVNVTGPNMITQTIHPLGTLREHATTIQVHTPHGKFATTLPQLPVHQSSPGPNQLPPGGTQALPIFPGPQPLTSMPTTVGSGLNTNTASNAHLAGGLVNQAQTNNCGGQPVEFNHAINYVNKIKNRFQNQPDIYKAFLEILHKYQKEQRNVKDSNGTYVPSLSESEVYSQVAKLFQNDEDLLREFGQFLPDAGGAVGASMTASAAASSTPLSTTRTSTTTTSTSGKVESVMKDHGATVKKNPTTHSSKPYRPSANQPLKRPAQPMHGSSSKRISSCSLKDISLSEASKHGSLSEFAFFDKVRKALRSQEAYDNFLRCLLLYNNEIIGKTDLVQLVHPFLHKFAELFAWFKKFLGHKEGQGSESESEPLPLQLVKEKHEGIAMEIDYTTLKKLGSSYRALPSTFQQPSCTGRDSLCQEVLNDTWVSFPSWSEDSQFVTSKKTPFEEHIYRCEDERFELDVVIETNLDAIRTFEAVNKKLSRMSDDDKTKFRLDQYLGGTSEVTQRKAIQRIYGDKASDIIDGLMKNPAVAVPIVLKRLKMKDEEWREAQHQFNKIWRNQNEKYYLKSLDHQGINFKANDIRFLRSKSLLNEIETLFDERQEAVENGSSMSSSGPHMTLTYDNIAVMDDAASLIIHHMKRQSAIHKDDKQRVRQVMHQFLPDLYFTPRGNQPSDDEDDEEDAYGIGADESDNESGDTKRSSKKPIHKLPGGYACGENVEGQYHLFYGNNNFYLFLRLHHILCERLLNIQQKAEILTEEENKEKKSKKGETVAEMLRLRRKCDIEVEEYYPSFLDMVRNLLDGNMDCSQYEDTLREMFTIHAYTAFTMDKLIQSIVRQLQHIVQDETCMQLLELYQSEEENQATGGYLVSQSCRVNTEAMYQRRAEHLTTDENCLKFVSSQKRNRILVAIELLEDPDEELNIDIADVAKWNDYLEQYFSSEDVELTDQLKERLSERPVFLQRNASHLRKVEKNKDEEGDNLIVNNTLEYKPQQGNYKLSFIPGTADLSYRLTCFSSARKTQKLIVSKLHERFQSWLSKWEQENVTRDMTKQTNNWLMGKTPGLANHVTTISSKRFGLLTKNVYEVHYTNST